MRISSIQKQFIILKGYFAMKFFSFTTLFVLSSVFLLAQPNSTPIPSQDTSWRYKMQTLQGTFGEIISQADPYFLNNPSDRDIKAYQRWRRFWDGRVADDESFSVKTSKIISI